MDGHKFQDFYERAEIGNKSSYNSTISISDPRVSHAQREFHSRNVRTVLDVGCGYGYFAGWFHSLGYKVVACDLSQKNLQYAQLHNPGPQYKSLDFENGHIRPEMDAAYCFDVIEHVYDYDAFVRNICLSLKKDGVLIISTPNVLAPKRRIRFLFGLERGLVAKAHIHFFAPANLREVLEANGFRCLGIFGSGKLSLISTGLAGNIWAIGIKI